MQKNNIENLSSVIYETYGQCNEDIILEGLLRSYVFKKRKRFSDIFYVEIGGNHPIRHSTTYLFYRKYECHGIIIEPIPQLCDVLRKVRPRDNIIEAVVSSSHDSHATLYVARHHALSSLNKGHISKFTGNGGDIVDEINVKNINVNALISSISSPVDFLSVDTEGKDFDILNGIDYAKFRPSFIQCEPGEDLEKTLILMAQQKYQLVALTDYNVVFADIAAFVWK